MKGLFKSLVAWTTKTGSKMTLLISALLNKHISVLFFLYLALSFFSFSLSLFLLFVCHASFITAGALSVSVWCSFISFSNPHLLSPSPSVLYDLLNTLCFQSCLFFLFSLFLLLPVDISVSLLAVVVGFCGLALLVVSLFVFWKLCWPIWRSKALSSNADSCPLGVLPEAPPAPAPAPAPPPVSRSVSPHPETKAIGTVGRQPSHIQHEDEEDKKRKVPEVKVNGRSSVNILEAAMKISQTSPDIPAEVQQALRDRLSKHAKIQRQTTEPTSSSRWYTHLNANYMINYSTWRSTFDAWLHIECHYRRGLIISLLPLE